MPEAPAPAPQLHTWNVRAEGRVQGVGYRRHVERWARELGVAGWVRNEHDGTVRAILQHRDAGVLLEITHRMRTGVFHAFVTNLEIIPVEPEPAQDYAGFEIKR